MGDKPLHPPHTHCRRARTHTRTYAHTHVRTHTTHTYTCTHTHAHTHTHARTHMHACTHARTHTHTHTHTHTQGMGIRVGMSFYFVYYAMLPILLLKMCPLFLNYASKSCCLWRLDRSLISSDINTSSASCTAIVMLLLCICRHASGSVAKMDLKTSGCSQLLFVRDEN